MVKHLNVMFNVIIMTNSCIQCLMGGSVIRVLSGIESDHQKLCKLKIKKDRQINKLKTSNQLC